MEDALSPKNPHGEVKVTLYFPTRKQEFFPNCCSVFTTKIATFVTNRPSNAATETTPQLTSVSTSICAMVFSYSIFIVESGQRALVMQGRITSKVLKILNKPTSKANCLNHDAGFHSRLPRDRWTPMSSHSSSFLIFLT